MEMSMKFDENDEFEWKRLADKISENIIRDFCFQRCCCWCCTGCWKDCCPKPNCPIVLQGLYCCCVLVLLRPVLVLPTPTPVLYIAPLSVTAWPIGTAPSDAFQSRWKMKRSSRSRSVEGSSRPSKTCWDPGYPVCGFATRFRREHCNIFVENIALVAFGNARVTIRTLVYDRILNFSFVRCGNTINSFLTSIRIFRVWNYKHLM